MSKKATDKVFDLPEKWKETDVVQGYYPTRLEYFAGKALQGLVVGRSDKDIGNSQKIARACVKLAQDLEDVVDSTQG